MNVQPCRVCDDDTEIVFNIKFKPVPICNGCADTIMLQQARDYVDKREFNDQLHNGEST